MTAPLMIAANETTFGVVYQRALTEVLDEVAASVPELAPAVAALRAAGS